MKKWAINTGREELTPGQFEALQGAEIGPLGLVTATAGSRQDIVNVVGEHASVLPHGRHARGAMLHDRHRVDYGIPEKAAQ